MTEEEQQRRAADSAFFSRDAVEADYVAPSCDAGLITLGVEAHPFEFLRELHARYGDVVRYRTRFGACVVFAHPTHVHAVFQRENLRRASLVKILLGEGLLASDGAWWRTQRQSLQRHFQPRRVTAFADVMASETAHTIETWESAARAGAPIDVSDAMTRLALRIALRTLFSARLEAEHCTALCVAVTRAVTLLGRISSTIFGIPIQLTPQLNAGLISARQVIDAICQSLVEERRARAPASRPQDLLTALIEADPPLEDRQVRDEMVTMLLAGHETSALSLSWAWHLLGEHSHIEKALHGEVDSVIPTPGSAVRLENLPWTRAVLQETLRLYPPVWFAGRVAQADDAIDGHTIERGTCVLVSAWLTQRHPSFWADPGRFDPRRFLPGAPAHERNAYFPFGGGRHTCLGMHFALLEGTLVLAHLARRFRVHPLNAAQVRPDAGLTLRQKPGLRALLERRVAA